MRRRLLALEMKKALGDRRFWLFLVLLIGLQCFFLYRAESKKGYSMEAYRAAYAQLDEWEPEEAAAYAKVRREVLSYARWGVWEETKADFLEAQSVPVTGFFPEQGIRMVMENGIGDAFVLLMALLSVYLIVFQGYENGLEPVLSCTKKGRGSVLASLCVGVWLAVYVPDFWLTAKTWSLDTLGVPVYSLPAFANFPLAISIGTYLMILYVWRLLLLFALGTGMLRLMDVFRNEMVGFLGMGVIFGLPYLLYYISGSAYGDWGLLRWLGFNAMMAG